MEALGKNFYSAKAVFCSIVKHREQRLSRFNFTVSVAGEDSKFFLTTEQLLSNVSPISVCLEMDPTDGESDDPPPEYKPPDTPIPGIVGEVSHV